MVEILALATVIAPVTSGLVEALKRAIPINKRFIPLVAIGIGMLLGVVAHFVDIHLIARLWAGGISGLAATGLFELGKNHRRK